MTVGLLVALAFGACGPKLPVASPPPAGSPSAAASGWVDAEVELPSDVVTDPSESGMFCSPCHGSATYPTAVVTASFGSVAAGFLQPGPHAVAWFSADGRSWKLIAGLPAADDGTAIMALAAGNGRIVAVGRDVNGAASWVTTDGLHWLRSRDTGQTSGPAGSTGMLAVTSYGSGFVAAGYAGQGPAGRSSGAVWTSPDGLVWSKTSGDVFAGGWIVALAVNGATIAAVGTAGSETRGPAAAWVSSDGTGWRAATSPAFGLGAMRAVAAGGGGFVAVGQSAGDTGAVVWTSADGADWQAVSDSPALHYYELPARMQGIAAAGSGFVAVGMRSDAGNGSAVAWRSTDGRSWTVEPAAATFSGAEMTAVAVGPAGIIGVGEHGLPDNAAASVWLEAP